MDSVKNFRIDPDRLWDSLMEMAKIGPGVAGGNNRQTLTDEDAEGRSLFETWCKDAGMTMGSIKLEICLLLVQVLIQKLFQYMWGHILIHSRLGENTMVS